MYDANLSDTVIRSTLTAMVAVITGRNDATRGTAEDYPMVWKGETVRGVAAAEEIFVESLLEYTDAWVDYLIRAENRKVATSMDVALKGDLAAKLEMQPNGVRITTTLRRVLNDIPVFEPMPTGEHRVIDLREEAPIDADTRS